MPKGPAILKLDAVMCLCASCGTVRPAEQRSPIKDLTGLSCQLCGGITQSLSNPEQIAHLVGAADPRQLRVERLRIVKDMAEIERQSDRKGDHLTRERKDDLHEKRAALRAAFLASIGAVPVPLTFYAVWLDTWEQATGNEADVSDASFSESEFGEQTGTDELYPWHRRCWLATIPFRRDEMLPLYGSSQAALFLPPPVSTEFLQPVDERNSPLLGHSSVQGLQRRGRSLDVWAMGAKPFVPTAYADVDELRSKRLRMRTLRRSWIRPPAVAAKRQTV